MLTIIGKPYALKQVNLSLVRKAIKENGSATRAEIVTATNISATTVRTLLTDMLKNGEIFDSGQDESIGGRKAVRYALNKNRFFGVALCLGNESVRYLTVNICGEICENGIFPVENNISESICNFLDGLVCSIEIKSIGIGVPGIVSGMGYQKKNTKGELENYPIGELINQRYDVPVILENDLNAIMLGFGRCYLKEFPEESCKDVHMAFIYFEKDCISAAFLSDGRIIRGWNNFAGELGFFPVEYTKTLDDLFASTLDNHQYSQIIVKMIAGICCILNPQYIAIGGEYFRTNCLPLISEYFNGILPDKMSTEIVYAQDIWHDYYEGMAHLTAAQIFSNVVLIKE